jgi:hypothetical protein
MKNDRLSELVSGSLIDIAKNVGSNEELIIKVVDENEIRIRRRANISVGQAVFATTWFLILVALVTIFIWKQDENHVVITYVQDHLSVTITGLLGGWLVSALVTAFIFRYIRQS